MMRRNVTFAIAGLSLLVWLAIGGAAVAEDAVIELHYIAATDVVTMFTPQQVTLRGGGTAAAEERTAVNFTVEAIKRANGMSILLAGHEPFVPSGARPGPGTGPVPAIRGVAEAILPACFSAVPRREPPAEAAASNGSDLLPEGLAHQLAVVPGKNAIAVRGTPEAINELREIVGLLDKPAKRVHLLVSLHEVTAAELQAKVPAVAEALDADGPAIRFALPNPEVFTDPGDLGRVLARVECTVLNGCRATVSLAEVVPVFGGTISLSADGTPVFESDIEAFLAGICMDIQVGAGPGEHIQLALRCLRVEAEGQTDVIMPMDIDVSDLAKMTVALRHNASLIMTGPSVIERYNEQREQSRSVHSQIQEDLRAVIVITPTVIMPDEGAVE